jgi:2-C-methyl-D-erythritol 4-phosphate cytidylyltransferase
MNTAIVLAAGRGSRMNAGMNKQFMPILGKPLLAHTLEIFQACRQVGSIILVAGKGELELCRKLIVEPYGFSKVDKLIEGGNERQESVYKGLLALEADCGIVLIHDGARPILPGDIIERCIEGAEKYGAVSAGMPAKETVKILDNKGFVKYTPQRELVWITQTPQAFRRDLIKRAHENAIAEGISGTDDASLVEILGEKVKMLESSYENIKITTPEDIIVAETLMGRWDNARIQSREWLRCT